MNPLKHAASFNGKLNQDAINTFVGIAQSIAHHATLSQWDRANVHMREALLTARGNSSNAKEFIKNAKLETGLLKSSHPLLVECVKLWY